MNEYAPTIMRWLVKMALYSVIYALALVTVNWLYRYRVLLNRSDRWLNSRQWRWNLALNVLVFAVWCGFVAATLRIALW